ncbi:MAG: sec-independent protein translocase protein TatC [Thermoleophilaceae bacterium]|jgi:sec-independent protein translocase protein TatC|nr:sec-independent protein translocase protein TatC [Thermoleophilaceae bacterium]
MRKQRPIGHEDRLTLVEHLDELRTRIVISVFAFVVAMGLCFWQNHRLLDIINDPLPKGQKPITLSPTEPFTTTLTVAAYAALLISLPVILYQLYAFILPAFSPNEKKVAVPLLLMVPVLFIAGAVFAYFVVVPAALTFLLNFNDQQFNTQIRARDYYSFVLLTLVSAGIVFQVPVGILGLTRLGILTPEKLKHNRRYAYLGCAVVAALLPGVDPVSMLIEMVPLVVLYELSILLSVLFGRSSAETADRLASAEGS